MGRRKDATRGAGLQVVGSLSPDAPAVPIRGCGKLFLVPDLCSCSTGP